MELRGYILPTILATLLHVVILGSLLVHWVGEAEPERRTPRHIQAKMIDLDALSQQTGQSSPPPTQQPDPRQQAEAQQREEARKAEQARQQAEAERQKQAQAEAKAEAEAAAERKAQAAAEQKRKAELEAKKKAEALAKKKAAEEAERKAQAQREAQAKAKAEAEAKARAEAQAKARAEAEAKKRAEEEAAAQARAEQARQAAAKRAESVVGDIQSYIHGLLQRNWRIPATARNGMEAVVSIRLLGNGEIDQASIVKSSGDAAFDRSALQAVHRTERFDRVAEVDPILFERRLRSIRVVFRPEGLRW
ncbi:cell envelope integrity protein TolA [Marinobacterium mangrovicola]|uniref:Cell division and transport-associated protein TolA n=1 Tax=Marinobacterium mangrovicola TaxID=1476959 RepID=A0A4R1GNJ4_9GAMM|nr:cell envelope integrity protein TolA [Marinobacterium mangrovicola]TCK08833.1 cell division and transport-associated protein TolA [Marinobacterium mangrovicola]